MTSKSKWVGIIVAVVLVLLVGLYAQSDIQVMGVTNLSSLHLSDDHLTATPVFIANQDGTGAIAIFEDAGTPVVSIYDGGATLFTGLLTASGGIAGGATGAVNLNGGNLTWDADADTISAASADDIVTHTIGAAGGYHVFDVGNVKIGDGSPSLSLSGEDLYVEGTFEADGTVRLDGDVTIAASSLTMANSLFYPSFDDLTVNDGDIITVTALTVYALDSGGNVTITLAPVGTEGQFLYLIGDDANDIVILDTNLRTSTGSALTLNQWDVAGFVFQDSEWLQLFLIANS